MAAAEQGAAELRKVNSVRIPVQEPHTKYVLQLGDGTRDDRMGNCKLLRCLCHASRLSDREEDVQVAELDPPSDPIIPAHGTGPLTKLLYRCTKIELFGYKAMRHAA